MTTAAPVSATWTPVDDLLLKNAMEDGDPLEALGRDAEKFSRRYTYKELRDRWHSLLYDPDVSVHSSVHMFELELSGFSPSSKSIKSKNCEGHKNVAEKRKQSIRKQYYDMRKRLRSEFFSSADLGLLNEPIIDDCQDHGSNMREPHDGKFVSDSLGLQKSDLHILQNVFPETVREYDASAVGRSNYLAECRNQTGDDYPNRIYRNEFPPDVSSLLREDGRGPSVADIKCIEISHAAKSNAPPSRKFGDDSESGLGQVLPSKRLFGNSLKKQLFAGDNGLDNPQNYGFGGSQLNYSLDKKGNSPLQENRCSSPHPHLPIWKPMEDFSVPSMPVCMGNQGTDQVVRTLLPDDDVGKGVGSSVFETVQSGTSLGLEHNLYDFMHASVDSDGDFVDISESLLNLSNEDGLPFTDVDENEAVDKIKNDNVIQVLDNSTGAVQGEDEVKLEPKMLNSEESTTILQNSPNACQLEDKVKCKPNLVMVEKPSKCAPGDLLLVNMEGVPSSPLDEHRVVHHLDGNLRIVPVVDGSIPSTSAVIVEPHKLDNGIIWCTLNTEDLEIPCNDDIFLLIHPSPVFLSSTSPPFSGDAMPLASISKGKIIEQQLNLSTNGKDGSQSFKWNQRVGPSYSQDAHLINPHLSCVSKPKLLDALNANRSSLDSSVNRLCNVTSNLSTDILPDKEILQAQLKDKHPEASFLDAPQYAEACQAAAVEPAINTTLSDPEVSENDDDVPYPSDVEAVILEMDLDLPGEESSITKQAFKFLPEDGITIMRLEQFARCSLQRTLTRQGAFAILYGRYLMQYIKKTEVLLGRSTDELEVDIDLRKEGRANQISRKQAIIKMEANGSFSLKNIGKVVVSVNGKSLCTGQSLILSSSCLIEINRMSLAFEINQKYVRRYMDASARKIFEKNKFDWSSDGIR